MKAKLVRTVAVAALIAVCGAGMALADPADKGAKGKGKGAGAKRGQGWDAFAAFFDGNQDGKVSKEEFLAKRPVFDRADSNHDGSVTREEVKALPAVQKKGGTGEGFVRRFDTDKDGKVSAAEYDAKRTTLFGTLDKNKDGAIDQAELKGHPKQPGEDAIE